jgi:hypothetical protein
MTMAGQELTRKLIIRKFVFVYLKLLLFVQKLQFDTNYKQGYGEPNSMSDLKYWTTYFHVL